MRTEKEILDEIAKIKADLEIAKNETIIAEAKADIEVLEQELKEVRAEKAPKEDKPKAEPKPKKEDIEDKPKASKAKKDDDDDLPKRKKVSKDLYQLEKDEVIEALKSFDLTKLKLPCPDLSDIKEAYIDTLYEFVEKKAVPKNAILDDENADDVYEWVADWFNVQNKTKTQKFKKEGILPKTVSKKEIKWIEEKEQALRAILTDLRKQKGEKRAKKAKSGNQIKLSEKFARNIGNLWLSITRWGGEEKAEKAKKVLEKFESLTADIAEVIGEPKAAIQKELDNYLTDEVKTKALTAKPKKATANN